MFHHNKIILGLALAAVGGVLSGTALGSQPEAEEVVVKGTKIPKSVTEMTHSVTVVDELEIRNQAFTDVTEILRQQAGLEFKQAGGVGQYNYIKLRGLGAGDVLVVIDGVKINRPSGGDTGHLLSQIDPEIIESVEILRGPQATLYGANASAGVIVINTKSGEEASASLGLEAGSQDWRKASASLRGAQAIGQGDWQYSLNLSDTDSDNVHDEEFFEDRTIQLKTSYEVGTVRLGVSVFDVDNRFGFAELNENSVFLSSRDQHWAYQTPDPDQYNDNRQSIYNIYLEHSISERLSHKVSFSRMENEYSSHDADNGLLGTEVASVDGVIPGARKGDILYIYDLRSPGIYLSPLDLGDPANAAFPTNAFYQDESDQVDYNLLYRGQGFDLLGGVEYIDQAASQWGSYGDSDNEDSQMSYYISGNLHLLEDRLVLSLGARTDDYESWGTETTGNIGLAWHVNAQTTLYGNAGTSFKPATMSQLFNPSYGDASLSPESGETMEVGIRRNSLDDRLSVEATYWLTQIDDVVFYDYSLPNPQNPYGGFGRYNNGQEAETSGLELTFSYRLLDSLTLDGNYTYTDSRKKPVGGDWGRSVQIARNKGNLGLQYAVDSLVFGVNTYYSGPRLRWNRDVEMKEYVRVDLSARYAMSDKLSFSLRVENLFDEDIEEGLGYEEPGLYGVFGVNYDFF